MKKVLIIAIPVLLAVGFVLLSASIGADTGAEIETEAEAPTMEKCRELQPEWTEAETEIEWPTENSECVKELRITINSDAFIRTSPNIDSSSAIISPTRGYRNVFRLLLEGRTDMSDEQYINMFLLNNSVGGDSIESVGGSGYVWIHIRCSDLLKNTDQDLVNTDLYSWMERNADQEIWFAITDSISLDVS